MIYENSRQALLYLMACALRGSKPVNVEVDFAGLYQLSTFHSVTAMVASALESGGYLTGEYMEQTVLQRWKDAKNNAIRKNILLDAERAQLFAWMEQNGIWHMPLKGSILKDMYPKLGMRQMADNDILFDKAFRRQVKDYMKSRGYQVKGYDVGVHDVYRKEPVYNFEMHVELFGETLSPSWVDYYRNIRDRLHKAAGKEYEYRFTDEDFYVYLVAHACKHFQSRGTGVRCLADVYVYLRQKAEQMDWEVLAEILAKLGITEFESTVRTLSLKLFSEPEMQPLTENEQKLLSALVDAGTYGTLEQLISKELNKRGAKDGSVTAWVKLKYVLWRMFPDPVFMKQYSTCCRKHPWSIPIVWIIRLFKAVLLQREAALSEIRIIKKLG